MSSLYFNNLFFIYFQINIINMDLIQYSTIFQTQQFNIYKNQLNNNFNFTSPYSITQSNQILSLLEKYHHIQNIISFTIHKITMNLSISSSFVEKLIYKCNNKIQKIILNRLFLGFNRRSRNITIKLNPINGQFEINYSVLIMKRFLEGNLLQFLHDILQFFKLEMIQQCELIFLLINHPYCQNKISKYTNILQNNKTKLMSSIHYAWNILQGSTIYKKQKKKDIYFETKYKFTHIKKAQSQKENIKYFSLVYHKSTPQITKLQQFTQQCDAQIKQKFLDKTHTLLKNSKQINQITLTHDALQYLIKRGQAKINCYQLGTTNIICKKVEASEVSKLKYEKKILQKLPKTQFIGIPKYYFIKNFQIQSQMYSFTNLIKVKSMNKFIQSNQSVISFFTIMTLLNQIANVLLYLRDAGIVYHNLIQKNILIKKGLHINLTDYSNAYHSDLQSRNLQINQIAKNILPYVSNLKSYYQKTYDDERSDVYSFGILIHQLIFGSIPHNIKRSFFTKQHQQYIITKISHPPLLALQKFDFIGIQYFKQLVYLTLIASGHQTIDNSNQQKLKSLFGDQKKFLMIGQMQLERHESMKRFILRRRPYLDWMTIIVKSISDCLHQIYH